MLSIGECPQISPRPGPEFQVVTATFQQHAARVLDLSIDGVGTPIGSTPNHPFWSEDRQQFVRADELVVGERLRQSDGSFTRLAAVSTRPGAHTVYNLEVQVEHTYHVAANGVLVHNGNSFDFPCDNFFHFDDLLDSAKRLAGQNPKDAAFGLADHIDDFTRRLGPSAERFPFWSLTDDSGDLASTLRQAMERSGKNHFNFEGFDAARYDKWLQSGGPNSYPSQGNVTHWELHELYKNHLGKTDFYGAPGSDFIPWPF
mgnify:CR=1 FL=1